MSPWWLFAIWAAVYVVRCALWPFARCMHCTRGKVWASNGKTWRPCWWCKGSGSRVRWLPRLLGKTE